MTKNRIFILLILILSYTLYNFYTKSSENILKQIYTKKADDLKSVLIDMIISKQNDTNALTYLLSQDIILKNAMKANDGSNIDYSNIINELQTKSLFKNIWIQVIDSDGISLYRSWTKKHGDKISKSRLDIQQVLKSQKELHSISTGKFDMTFKAIIPIFEDNEFLGLVEMITHFNSIAKRLKNKNIDPVFLVDKSYKEKIIHPLTKLFIDNYYVANKNASKIIMNKIEKEGVEKFISINDYIIYENKLVTLHKIPNINNKPMGYQLLFYDIENIDMKMLNDYTYNFIFLIFFIALFIILLTVIYLNKIYTKRLGEKVVEKTKNIEDQKNQLKKLISSYDQNVIFSSTDLNGIITNASSAFCKISGYKADELIGQPHNLVRHPDTKNSIFKELWETIQSGKVWQGEIKNKAKDGSYYWTAAEITPEFDKAGNIISYYSVRHDITSKKDFEKQYKILKESEKMASMGEMIGNIAHQWRQPLSVISTSATGMQIKKEYNLLSDEEFNKSCNDINTNAQYLSKTIEDFRNFIKGDRKKSLFLLKDNINSFLNLVKGSVKNNNIDVILNLQDDIKIDGYENELTQCFINIFNNAKDVLAEQEIENKYIFISTYLQDDKAIIIIKDNAGGITQDVLPKIFEPYFTTKHKSQGTGLGLHMTYSLIVDGMDGTIKAKNKSYEYKNKTYTGAEFMISLPIE